MDDEQRPTILGRSCRVRQQADGEADSDVRATIDLDTIVVQHTSNESRTDSLGSHVVRANETERENSQPFPLHFAAQHCDHNRSVLRRLNVE
jgi:hypothetical protein